jgi:hypothetical protein
MNLKLGKRLSRFSKDWEDSDKLLIGFSAKSNSSFRSRFSAESRMKKARLKGSFRPFKARLNFIAQCTSIDDALSFHPTLLPGFTLLRVVVTLSEPSKLTALRIIPWLSKPIILREGKLAMKRTSLPTSSSG